MNIGPEDEMDPTGGEEFMPAEEAAELPEQDTPDEEAAEEPVPEEIDDGADEEPVVDVEDSDVIASEDFVPGEARPVGTVEDAIRRHQEDDPSNAEEVTNDEQAQYEDFVRRAVMLVCDQRKASEEMDSPADAIMKLMNNPNRTVPEAIGYTAAAVTMMISNNARRQKMRYDPDVLYHGADELIATLYVLGNVAGIFDGVDPLPIGNPETKGTDEDGNEVDGPTDGFSIDELRPQDMKIIEAAKMVAVQEFGKMLESSGQISAKDRKDNEKFWKAQIKREVDAGKVDGEMFDKLDIDTLRAQMQEQQERGAANGP